MPTEYNYERDMNNVEKHMKIKHPKSKYIHKEKK